MVQQQIPFANECKEIRFTDERARDRRQERRVAQRLVIRQPNNLPQIGECYDAVNLVAVHFGKIERLEQ